MLTVWKQAGVPKIGLILKKSHFSQKQLMPVLMKILQLILEKLLCCIGMQVKHIGAYQGEVDNDK